MVQGSSQARTARIARGQLAGWGWWGLFVPPLSGPRWGGGRWDCWDDGGLLVWQSGEPGVPTEGERAGNQGLVAAYGGVGADLEVGPSEFVLDLFVALLDPVSNAVDPDDFVQVSGGFGTVGLAGAAGAGQVGGQVPGGLRGQRSRIGGGHDQADVPVGPPEAEGGVGGPPGLGAPVAEGPLDLGPVSGILGVCPGQGPGGVEGV